MTYYNIVESISPLIATIVAIVLLYLDIKSKRSILEKIVAFIFIVLIFAATWFLSAVFLELSLANIMPMDRTVPCYHLTDKNCEKRLDCYLSPNITGSGRASYSCIKKI